MSARPVSSSASTGVRYMPGLDGIRALAVLSVMAYHGGLSFLPAGFFGVDAFFVLSGFLITTLLVSEWDSSKGIALARFWARRARRLLPALLVVLVFVVLYARFVAAPGTYPGLRFDGISALFYSANWRFIVSNQNYFVANGPVSPLLHTWSLAIEEQFYIVWPLVVLGVMRLGRKVPGRGLKALLAVSVLGAAASALEMAVLFNPAANPTREYFGTDTHAQCLLVGAALACALTLWRRGGGPEASSARGRLALSLAGLLGVGVCAWAWSQWHYGQAVVFRGGFLVVSVAVAAVILCTVVHPGALVSRALASAPLRFLGRISYGMYLWHFPLDIALTGTRTGLEGTELFLARSAITVAIATVSFYGLERPIRQRVLLSSAAARFVTPAAVLGTAAVVVLGTVTPVGAASSPVPSGPAPGHPVGSVPASLADAPVRVMLVGDSTALTLGVGLAAVESHWHIDQSNLAILGCGVDQGSSVWDDSQGQLENLAIADPCRLVPKKGYVPWPTAWSEWIRSVKPNVVVLLAGRWEVDDRTYLGHRTNILHAAYATYTKHQLEEAVRIGTSTGARMVLMTAPCYSEGEQLNGDPWPQDAIARVQKYNTLVRAVGAEFPSQVSVQDLYALTCPGGKFMPTLDGKPLRGADGVHFSPAPGGGALLAPQILPLWETLGHEQEAAGGAVQRGRAPQFFQLPRA